MVNFGNPEPKKIKKILKLIIILHFFKVFANKLCRNKGQSLVCESTEKWVFQRAGPIFKKFIFVASLESIS